MKFIFGKALIVYILSFISAQQQTDRKVSRYFSTQKNQYSNAFTNDNRKIQHSKNIKQPNKKRDEKLSIDKLISINEAGHQIFKKGSPQWLENRRIQTQAILSKFSTFDARLRPNMKDTNIVKAQVQIVGLGPIDDLKEEYEICMFFRLSWYDERLQFNETYLPRSEELRLGSNLAKEIWYPDIYFRNSKKEYFHNNTQPNRLIRIRGDGKVVTSSRLSITAKCDMSFSDFPFDVHTCNLVFSSYQYTKHDLWLQWHEDSPVEVPVNEAGGVGLRLLQFNLTHSSFTSTTMKTLTGEYSSLIICFQFERYISYYIINTYLPCYLLVFLSQVSFWINKEATPARMTYGSMTVLALTLMSISERQTVPKVAYATAYDFYITTCFSFCFAALIEFAIVNHFTIIQPKKIIDDVVNRRRKQKEFTSGTAKPRNTLIEPGENFHINMMKKDNKLLSLPKSQVMKNKSKDSSIRKRNLPKNRIKSYENNNNLADNIERQTFVSTMINQESDQLIQDQIFETSFKDNFGGIGYVPMNNCNSNSNNNHDLNNNNENNSSEKTSCVKIYNDKSIDNQIDADFNYGGDEDCGYNEELKIHHQHNLIDIVLDNDRNDDDDDDFDVKQRQNNHELAFGPSIENLVSPVVIQKTERSKLLKKMLVKNCYNDYMHEKMQVEMKNASILADKNLQSSFKRFETIEKSRYNSYDRDYNNNFNYNNNNNGDFASDSINNFEFGLEKRQMNKLTRSQTTSHLRREKKNKRRSTITNNPYSSFDRGQNRKRSKSSHSNSNNRFESLNHFPNYSENDPNLVSNGYDAIGKREKAVINGLPLIVTKKFTKKHKSSIPDADILRNKFQSNSIHLEKRSQWRQEKYKRRNAMMERTREKEALIAMTTDSSVDRYSRVIFPVLFFLFNISYWWIYSSKKRRLTVEEVSMHCSLHDQ